MAKASTKQDLAQSALTIIRERLGSESISLQRDDMAMKIPVTPTGLEVLDHYVLRCGGLPQGRIIELFSEEGVGKAQPIDTVLPTPHGFTTIGDLQVGDYVFGVDGKATQVIGIFPQGEKPIFRVRFSDNTSTRACGEHLWSVRTHNHERRNQRYLVISTEELRKSGLFRSCGDAKWRVPVTSPVELGVAKNLPIHPYLLGVLLGDGCLTRGAVISNSDPQMHTIVSEVLPHTDKSTFDGKYIRIRRAYRSCRSDGSWEPSSTLHALRQLGLCDLRAEEKFVPDRYLWGAIEQRLQLLQGLLDTDGYARDGVAAIEYATVSEKLAQSVSHLVASLGGVSRTSYKAAPTYTYQGEKRIGKPCWRVLLRLPNLLPFRLQKHLVKYKSPHRVIRKIIAIEPIGKAQCVCIKVAALNGLYLTDDWLVTHNTSLGYTFLAAAQQQGGLAALIDTENSFDPIRAAIFGVNVPDLLIAQPDHLDEVIPQIEAMVEILTSTASGPAVVVWDSVAATATRDEYEGGFEVKDQMGQRAKLLSKAMRVIGQRVARKPASVVCINQVREKLGVIFGDKYTTPGGHAIKFHASVRLQLFRGKAVKNTNNEHIGNTVTIMGVKNRFAPPYRKAQVRLDYDKGWNNVWSTVSHAKDQKIVPTGAKYSQKTYEEAISQLGWFPEDAVKAEAAPELPNS